jgi:hypothetical protein
LQVAPPLTLLIVSVMFSRVSNGSRTIRINVPMLGLIHTRLKPLTLLIGHLFSSAQLLSRDWQQENSAKFCQWHYLQPPGQLHDQWAPPQWWPKFCMTIMMMMTMINEVMVMQVENKQTWPWMTQPLIPSFIQAHHSHDKKQWHYWPS